MESKPQRKTAIRKDGRTESQHQADLRFHFLLRARGVFQVLRMQGLCDLSNLQASARAAPVAPSPPAVLSPQQADKHSQIIHSTHYNADALPGPCRTRAFFSGGALISTMRLMAHYRPIHKYCLQYYHFQGLLSSPEIYSSLLHHAIVFFALSVFIPHPSVFHTSHSLPQEDDGGGNLFHLELKQGQRNIK